MDWRIKKSLQYVELFDFSKNFVCAVIQESMSPIYF